jgi:hypothetical protein
MTAPFVAALLLTTIWSYRGALVAQETATTPVHQPAPVESLTATVLDSVPALVEVEVAGSLADACTRIALVEETARPDEHRIRLDVESVRSPGSICAQMVTPYRLTLRLDVSALAEGEYVVEASGAEAPFTIEPVGDFPAFSLALFESDSRVIVPAVGLSLIGPGGWERTGLSWKSEPFWSSRIGLRWHEVDARQAPGDLLPPGATLHESSQSRLGWGTGIRYRISRDNETRWSEHLFTNCASSTLCEFWMEAPSEPLLEAAGESFWRMVRFTVRVTTD